MDICMVGSSGHNGYVLGGIADGSDDRVVGIAPGSAGEDVRSLAKTCQSRGQSPKAHDDYRKMLDEAKPDIVTIACHFADLATVAIEALERGAHVFMEKPVATTLEDLGRLREAHARSGRHLAAMLGIRYEPAMRAARRAVADGAIGEVRLVTGQKSYKLGTRPAFYKTRATYGGTIPWVGVHAIDWVGWFSDAAFLSVRASHSTRHNRDHGELEVSSLCHFTMEREIFASVNADYLRPARAETHGDDRVRVAGSDGVVEVRAGTAYLTNDASGGTVELLPVSEGQIFADLLAQIRGTGECLVSAADSFKATEAALLARQSADEGRELRFPSH